MRILAATLVWLVLPLTAGRAAAQDAAGDETLDQILKRAGSKDPFTVYLALKDFDQWRESVPDAAARVEARRAGAAGAGLAGIEAALDHLNPKPEVPDDPSKSPREPEPPAEPPKRDPATLRALALEREAEMATGGDAKRCWGLLKAIVGRDAFTPRASGRDLRKWANEEPVTVRALLEGYRFHPSEKIAGVAREIVTYLDELIPWFTLQGALDTLGIPQVAGCERIRVVLTDAMVKAGVPGYGGTLANGWLLQGTRYSSLILFDDGCVRSGVFQYTIIKIDDELAPYSVDPRSFPHGEDGFWRALLLSRWASQLDRLDDGAACRKAVQSIAAEEWPLEEPGQLAARVLRRGADRLRKQAEEDAGDESENRLLTSRLAALPFEECRKAAEDGMARWKRVDQGEQEWGDSRPKQVEQGSMRRRVEYWTWRLVRSGLSKDIRLADLVEAVDTATSGSENPAESLAALGWDGIPFLIGHLDDRAPIGLRRGKHAITVGDVCLVILTRTFGRRLPTTPDPVTGWPTLSSPADEVQADLLGRWDVLGSLQVPARWLALYREGSALGADWFFAHDPAVIAREEFARLAPDGRRRELGGRRLERKLGASPSYKLADLRDSCDGELREIVERALAAQSASPK